MHRMLFYSFLNFYSTCAVISTRDICCAVRGWVIVLQYGLLNLPRVEKFPSIVWSFENILHHKWSNSLILSIFMQVIVFNSHPQTLTERKTLSELFHMIGFAMFFLTFHFFFWKCLERKLIKHNSNLKYLCLFVVLNMIIYLHRARFKMETFV